ncbi:MAG: rRNA maturation RNase YbeY [Opitutaceae bacterium]
MNPKPRSVHLHNGCPGLKVPVATTRRLFQTLDAFGRWPVPPGSLSVAFLDRDTMCQVHESFLQDGGLTDVITFEGDPDGGLAGEICVSPDQALAFKGSRRLPFAEELTLYLVHGYLHLAGLDDLDPAKRRRMRAAERQAMTHLREAGAIPAFTCRRP